MRAARILSIVVLIITQPSSAGTDPDVTFDGKTFSYSVSEEQVHSFTPRGQENLEAWEEMLSFVYDPSTATADQRKTLATSLAERHQQTGKLIKAIAGPGGDEPAWFMVVAIGKGSGWVEGVFSKVAVQEAGSVIVTYSRRFYGDGVGSNVVRWLQENGHRLESELAEFDEVPNPSIFAGAN